MKLVTPLTLVLTALLAACGTGAVVSATSGARSGAGSGSGSGGQATSLPRAGALAAPPPPGPPVAPDGTVSRTLAITKLYLGDADADGMPDLKNGWQSWGYNIDGVPPGNTSAFCQPADAARAAVVHQHGAAGIENSFGQLVLPILRGIALRS